MNMPVGTIWAYAGATEAVSINHGLVAVFRYSTPLFVSDTRKPNTMAIVSLDEFGYELKQTIPVVIEVLGDEFIAEFQEASIATSGSSVLDAVRSLKSLLIDLFEVLSNETRLGPYPRAQLASLRRYIGEKAKPD